ncbi:type II toxin-antitoxin system RelE/ParE family toxin [Actimicrobium antarcticum]
MVRQFWTSEALYDRRAIYDYIETDNPRAALTLDEMLSEKVRHLIDHPELGRIGRITGTRELVVHKNYILIDDTTDELVRILRVLHVARQWPPADR